MSHLPADFHRRLETGLILLPPLSAEQSVRMERESRAMFVTRLEHLLTVGQQTISINEVLALLNDCDFLASRR